MDLGYSKRVLAHSMRSAGSRLLATRPLRDLLWLRRRKAVEGALAQGLPPVLAEPLRFLASGVASAELKAVQSKVETARAQLPELVPSFASNAELMPLGSMVSVSREWGSFLHLCVRSSGAQTLLELGVAGGISGSYLATAPSCRTYFGLDGAVRRLEIAKRTLALSGVTADVNLVPGHFDETLPALVAGDRRFDFVYVDGDHRMEPTLRHMRLLGPRLVPGTLVVFDDIRWSTEMYATWQGLTQWPGFTHAVDVGRMGVCVWQGGDVRPRVWNLAKGLAWPKPVRVTTRSRVVSV